MYDKFLENYIDTLLLRQNDTRFTEQKNLFSKNEYYELLKPVINLVKNNKDKTIEELRELIYINSNIEELVKDFIYKKKLAPGIVFSYGTDNYQETIVAGNKQEFTLENDKFISKEEVMTIDTIFDLASVTKLFTSITIMKLVSLNMISLDDDITYYVPQFHNLKGVTIFDLISFNVPIKTCKRVDDVSNRLEAEKILFDIEKVKYSDNRHPYTDMGAMILKYVIESVTGMSYYSFLKENILDKISMYDTYVNIPSDKIIRVANGNYDYKYFKDGLFVNTNNYPGIAYDSKAQVMGQSMGNLSGHAGLFSTVSNMTLLAKSLINNEIFSEEYLDIISQNRTGRMYYEDGMKKYVQYHGFLIYSKCPDLNNTEVYEALSGKAFASAGWSGTQITVDPLNKINFSMAANRSHNRFTYIEPTKRDLVKINEYGKKFIKLDNGMEIVDATRFAWDRGTMIVKPAIKLAMQYQMLEELFKYHSKDKEKVRHI